MWCFFAISIRRDPSLARLLFITSVAGRRPGLEKGGQGRQEPAGDRYGSLLQTGIVAKFEKLLQFFQWHSINYVFRHVVAEIGLHSSNFLREKRSSSQPGRFQTKICSKVRDQRNSKHAVHFKLEIRDSQNLAKLGLGGKPSLLVFLASNEEIKRSIRFFLVSMVFHSSTG